MLVSHISDLQCTDYQFRAMSTKDQAAQLGLVASTLLRQTVENARMSVPEQCSLCALAKAMGLDENTLHQLSKASPSFQVRNAQKKVIAELSINVGDADVVQLAGLSDGQAMQYIAWVRQMQPYVEATDRLRRIVASELEGSNGLFGAVSVSGPSALLDAGVDPQIDQRYRTWLTRLETSVCRRAKNPQDPDEIGFGEIPDSDIAGKFGMQADPTVYAGGDLDPLGNGYTEARIRSKFWSRPSGICARNDLNKQVMSMGVLQSAAKQADIQLKAFRSEPRVSALTPVLVTIRHLGTGEDLIRRPCVPVWSFVQPMKTVNTSFRDLGQGCQVLRTVRVPDGKRIQVRTPYSYEVEHSFGLRSTAGFMLRCGEGVVAWKLVKRNLKSQMRRAMDLTDQARDHLAQVTRALDARRKVPADSSKALHKFIAGTELDHLDTAGVKIDPATGMTYVLTDVPYGYFRHLGSKVEKRQRVGIPTAIWSKLHELRLVERAIRKTQREAGLRGRTWTGQAWIRAEKLPEDLRDSIKQLMPEHLDGQVHQDEQGRITKDGRWAVQVQFDPYQSGHLEEMHAADDLLSPGAHEWSGECTFGAANWTTDRLQSVNTTPSGYETLADRYTPKQRWAHLDGQRGCSCCNR